MDQPLAEVLDRLVFTAALPQQVSAVLASMSKLERFSAGQVIFREGDATRILYVVVSGRVMLEMQVPGRAPMRILSLGPGEMLAWSAVLNQGGMTATARVVEDVEVVAICAGRLLEICEQNPQIGYALMRQVAIALSERLVATRLQLLNVFGEPH
ncbi:MAG TPA: cyclic nucleotide-binding domain-containing protein [Pirellulales bacterium]|jgi:CRP-like cAMP-binding protein|nr:cyclic nucleotide-binding domain-containing protein [Pirellulales bacterium]